MMHRMIRLALILCLALGLTAGLAGGASAETPQQRMETALQAEGYIIVQSERTWLGRLRIIAIKGDLRREVVINPGTGEVLRDIASIQQRHESGDDGNNAVASSGGGGGTGSAAAPGVVSTFTAAGNVAVDDPAPAQPGFGIASDGSISTTLDVLLPEAGVQQ